LRVEAGDVAIADTQVTGGNQKVAVSAQTATVSAARNLILASRQLLSTGDLKLQAGESVRIRDSAANPFVTNAGGNLTVQGDRQIDIQARNQFQSLLSAGGRITLTSNGTVSGDAFFRAGSDFSIATLQGSPGNFASSGGSKIVSGGNVSFGNYAGASLGVQAKGTIASSDIAISSSASSAQPQLVLTAGNVPTALTGNSTLAPASSSPANIQVGNIAISGSVFLGAANSIQAASITSNGGDLALVASGDIAAGNLDTSTLTGNAGKITLYSTGGSINTSASSLNASSLTGNGGSIFLYGANAIATGGITTSSFIGNGGGVTLYSEATSVRATSTLAESRQVRSASLAIYQLRSRCHLPRDHQNYPGSYLPRYHHQHRPRCHQNHHRSYLSRRQNHQRSYLPCRHHKHQQQHHRCHQNHQWS
jgi:hypothetical protein